MARKSEHRYLLTEKGALGSLYYNNIPNRYTTPSRYKIQQDHRTADRNIIRAHEDVERKRLKQIAAEEERKRLRDKVLVKMICKTCMVEKSYITLQKMPNTTKLVRPMTCIECYNVGKLGEK